ncbi:hypothetical protein RchiOBHm_Chr5g0017971 [Rosa chinensis]|uniref:Uncharacterized protein n=1 Tax=Rosa chinensis TaxID=74649 RepID=A0A2P6Q6M4_ROSCH|nr:hypothetical protein RchiOBHm_Chr5g0017971 [Rosa chinensis]
MPTTGSDNNPQRSAFKPLTLTSRLPLSFVRPCLQPLNQAGPNPVTNRHHINRQPVWLHSPPSEEARSLPQLSEPLDKHKGAHENLVFRETRVERIQK